MNVLLISENKLKSEGLIDDNMNGNYIRPAIKLAQDEGLQTILGGLLYEKVISLVNSGSIASSEYAAYKTLLDEYITPYLQYKVLAEIQPIISFKQKNQGTVTVNNEYTTNAEMKEVNFLVQKWQYNADFYGRRMSDYLVHHCTLYPEFHNHEAGKLAPNTGVFNTGLYLGPNINHCCHLDD